MEGVMAEEPQGETSEILIFHLLLYSSYNVGGHCSE